MKKWADYEKKATAAKASKGKIAPPLPPKKDYRLEGVADILSGKLWVRCHAYQSEEMLSIMRLCREYGVKLVCFEHGLEGYRITNELVEYGVAVSHLRRLLGLQVGSLQHHAPGRRPVREARACSWPSIPTMPSGCAVSSTTRPRPSVSAASPRTRPSGC